eukprot:gene50089-67072_t
MDVLFAHNHAELPQLQLHKGLQKSSTVLLVMKSVTVSASMIAQ